MSKYCIVWDENVRPEEDLLVFDSKVDAQVYKAEHPLGKFASVMVYLPENN